MFGLFKRKETPKAVRRVIRKRVSRSSFGGASISSLFSEWDTVSTPINSQLEKELRTLRARARQLRRDDPYIRRFHSLCRSNVVGPNGFVLRSEVLLKNGKPAKREREAIERAWKRAGKKGAICTLRKRTLIDIENMAVDQIIGDGEVLIMSTENPRENEFGISFKFIDPELLDVNHREDNAPYQVRMGVETDRVGRVVAYHLHSQDTTHQDFYQWGGKGFIRVPARRIIHAYFDEFIDQIRGFPHSVAAMKRLRMLDGYEEAELVAARVGSAAMGFIEEAEDGRGIDEADDVIADDEVEEIVEEVEPEIEMEPGFHRIAHGSNVHTFQTNHPTTAYKDYIKTVLRAIASGLGIDYNTLANDLEGVNFSSLRGGVLESRELWKCFQVWMIDHVLEPIFDKWLENALLNNAIRMPKGDPLRAFEIDRLKEKSFQGRRWAWVDPLKDLQAAKLAIDEGLASRSEFIRERGGDPEQVWSEIQREQELMNRYGVEVFSAPTESVVSNEGADNAEN